MTDTALSAARQLAPHAGATVRLRGADGRHLAALRISPAGEPRGVAVLLPGYTGGKEDFAPILDPLCQSGFEVLALDLPGQYQSPGPAEAAGYFPAALARDVVAVAGALRAERADLPLHLVGHSYGGLVARAAVLAAPAAFDSLVLLDSGPGQIGGGRRALVDALEPVLVGHGVAGVYEASLAAARTDPRWQEPPPELAAFLRTRFLASPAAAVAGMGDAIRTEPDRVAELAALHKPILVVYGADDDAWSPAEQDTMATRLGARRHVITGAAHSPAVENPGALATVLTTFWRSLR